MAYITVAALGTLLLPPCQHMQCVVDFLNKCVFHHWKRHISLKIVHEHGFDSQQQYLVACFPHGAFPLAAQMHATLWPSLNDSPLSLLAASVLFYCPLWRHYMSVGAPLQPVPSPATCPRNHDAAKIAATALRAHIA